jgi:hypothetical protein
MTLSVKNRLEARIKYEHCISFSKLVNIIKSINWNTIYIQYGNASILTSYIDPAKYPKNIVITKITERRNQIWSRSEGEILATVVTIEEF